MTAFYSFGPVARGLCRLAAALLAVVYWAGCASVPPAVELAEGVSGAGGMGPPAPYVDPAETADEATAYPYIELLTEALVNIRKYYVDEKTYREITYGAIHGMLEALDEHSAFLEEQDYSDMKDDTEGKFSGIGVTLGLRDGILTVIAPIEDSPAFRAGAQAGDRIVEIDGEKTTGLNLRDAVKKLRGAKGTTVSLGLLAPDAAEPRTVELVRDDIRVPSIKGARIVRDGVGYVRLTQFTKTTPADLMKAMDELLEAGMTALVLDLRNNSGGLLTVAVDVVQPFLPRDAVIVTTRGRPDVHAPVEIRAGGVVRLPAFPMVVLVNGGSASAAEIVAGALRDHRRAVLLGTRTFGKASVQSVVPLGADPRTAVRLTIAHYYTPGGAEIHNVGIEPDIRVELTPETWRRVQTRRAHLENPEHFDPDDVRALVDVVDDQMERAVDLLQAMRIFR